MPVLSAIRNVIRLRRKLRGPHRPGWDEEFELWATLLHQYSKRSTWLPLRYQRAALKPPPPSAETRRMRFAPVSAGGVRAEWFHAPDADPSRVMLYLHGGGYSIGSIDSHRDLISRLCIASGATGLALDYRLAPEHRFPAQLDDALVAYRWLIQRGIEPSRLVVAGESAGGGLTLSTLIALRDAGDPLPAAGVCISPWVDLEAEAPSMHENERYDYVSGKVLRIFAERFVDRHQLRHPLAAPLYADLAGLPPLLIQAGAAEVLLDDARRIAHRARQAGVAVELEIEDDMIHVWHLLAAISPRARESIERVGRYIRART